MLICLNSLAISSQNKNDSVSINKLQVKNIYIGLKQLNQYKKQSNDCYNYALELDKIIQTQNDCLKVRLCRISEINLKVETLNKNLNVKSVEIETIKNKKIPWYRNPILYLLIGAASGIYIAK